MLEQVVIGIAGIVVDAFLHPENLDGEDGGLAVAQAGFRGGKQVVHHHPGLRRGIHAVIDGREGHLRAGAGIHGVQVVYQRFHGLIGGAIGFLHSLFVRKGLQAGDGRLVHPQAGQGAAVRGPEGLVLHQRGMNFPIGHFLEQGHIALLRVFHAAQKLQRPHHVVPIPLGKGLLYAFSHGIIEIDDALTAVLIVLVGLNGNAGQGGIGRDILGLPQKAVAGGESVVEQLDQVDLGACGGQGQKIHVVDVNVAVAVGFGVLGLQNKHQVELLCALGSVFQHGAHGGVAIDVGIFPLDVGIHGGLVGNVVVYLHQPGVHFANAAALGAIENIILGDQHKAVVNEHPLYHVLNLFHRGNAVGGESLLHLRDHLVGELVEYRSRLRVVVGRKGLIHRLINFVPVKRHNTAVALFDVLNHCLSFSFFSKYH